MREAVVAHVRVDPDVGLAPGVHRDIEDRHVVVVAIEHPLRLGRAADQRQEHDTARIAVTAALRLIHRGIRPSVRRERHAQGIGLHVEVSLRRSIVVELEQPRRVVAARHEVCRARRRHGPHPARCKLGIGARHLHVERDRARRVRGTGVVVVASPRFTRRRGVASAALTARAALIPGATGLSCVSRHGGIDLAPERHRQAGEHAGPKHSKDVYLQFLAHE
ncbi:hypothetical protein WMF39_42030 [Sorangium sp. So ce1504]|uniref:hypothetical protein n=1 Tax=Sorangium sp. So ce1504 TaxID=3133337 RepID=UPI003F609FCA